MKTKALLAIALIVSTSIQSALPEQSGQPPEQPPGPPREWLLQACVVVGVGAGVGAIYLVSRKCKPKYYWLMDNDSPPNFWVATATRKECSINDWTRIGGPYDGPGDAPPQHPDPTNRVDNIVGPIMKISVQSSTNMTHWTTVHSENADMEDFVYYPTNAGMFRFEMGP